MTARQRATIAAALAFGIAAGVGVFTFGYAKGASYLTNDPAACANCHIMSEHFSAWQKGSHRTVTCNDCHTPHNMVGKYVTKARNGFWHSFYFTTGRFPDPLRITEGNREVTEETCRYCHGDIVDAIDPPNRHTTGAPTPRMSSDSARASASPGTAAEELSCIRCHRYVGHLVR